MSEVNCPKCGSNDVAMREYKQGERMDETPTDEWLYPFAMLCQRNETLGETVDYWVAEMDFIYLRCRNCNFDGGLLPQERKEIENDV